MPIDLNKTDYYINREFTALAFNERVFELAHDKRIPLLERMRFLCICSSNLDEFFEIRVAALKQDIENHAQETHLDGLSHVDILSAINKRTHELIKKLYQTFNQQILPELKKERIYFIETEEWDDDIKTWAKEYFKKEILPIVSPIALDPAHPLPRLFNKSLNFIVSLSGKDAFDRHINYAVVHAPRSLPRLIQLPEKFHQDGYAFVHLTSIIKTYVHYLFPGMTINSCCSFRLTRNSDLYLSYETTEDLAKAVQKELFSRDYGDIVRLEIEKACSNDSTEFLLKKYKLKPEDAYYCDGPVNFQRYLEAINTINRPDLNYPPFTPNYPCSPSDKENLFHILDDEDILIHHPYQSFDLVVNFLRQAASDPNVYTIKQTLYRVPHNSMIVEPLIEAARSGKEVTAAIELRARFDEAANLQLARRLQEAGVLVVYGVVGYKMHAKMSLVVRRVNGKLKRYVHLGTGNYHEETTKHYTDIGLLTSHRDITKDIQSLFQQLTGLGKAAKLKEICHSPFTLQKSVIQKIKTCQETAEGGFEAEIIIKVNGLTDRHIIQALYAASQAGVKIHLIIRAQCCIKPRIKGVSDNIRVTSIVGRFLEHHRVYYFRNKTKEEIFCASADLMERNLYKRIEILFPILDINCQKRIKQEILAPYLKDNTDTWEMQPDGSYKACKTGTYSAQEALLQKFKEESDPN